MALSKTYKLEISIMAGNTLQQTTALNPLDRLLQRQDHELNLLAFSQRHSPYLNLSTPTSLMLNELSPTPSLLPGALTPLSLALAKPTLPLLFTSNNSANSGYQSLTRGLTILLSNLGPTDNLKYHHLQAVFNCKIRSILQGVSIKEQAEHMLLAFLRFLKTFCLQNSVNEQLTDQHLEDLLQGIKLFRPNYRHLEYLLQLLGWLLNHPTLKNQDADLLASILTNFSPILHNLQQLDDEFNLATNDLLFMQILSPIMKYVSLLPHQPTKQALLNSLWQNFPKIFSALAHIFCLTNELPELESLVNHTFNLCLHLGEPLTESPEKTKFYTLIFNHIDRLILLLLEPYLYKQQQPTPTLIWQEFIEVLPPNILAEFINIVPELIIPKPLNANFIAKKGLFFHYLYERDDDYLPINLLTNNPEALTQALDNFRLEEIALIALRARRFLSLRHLSSNLCSNPSYLAGTLPPKNHHNAADLLELQTILGNHLSTYLLALSKLPSPETNFYENFIKPLHRFCRTSMDYHPDRNLTKLLAKYLDKLIFILWHLKYTYKLPAELLEKDLSFQKIHRLLLPYLTPAEKYEILLLAAAEPLSVLERP